MRPEIQRYAELLLEWNRTVNLTGATLLVHPSDRDQIGIADGEEVQATSGRGLVVLPVRAAPGIPRGVAFLSFNQPGPGASDLIDAGALFAGACGDFAD